MTRNGKTQHEHPSNRIHPCRPVRPVPALADRGGAAMNAIDGFGAALVFIVILCVTYSIAGHLAEVEIARDCETFGAFMANGLVFECKAAQP